MGMENIEHVVVVMMENRSFDNLLGWLYDNSTNRPAFNIPSQSPTTFDGLAAGTYSNTLNGTPVFASRPPTGWPPANNPNVVPTPDPHEEFDHIAHQLYGTFPPPAAAQPDMSGFLADYATAAGTTAAGQIMQSFGLREANVINELALNFAVCDRWFASVPAQTWPNRGFVHTGSSDGHINNDFYELYDIPTIFNVLGDQKESWGVFCDTNLIPSLTFGQFSPRLLDHVDRFRQYKMFKALCQHQPTAPAARKLPAYSFIEPRFVTELGLFKIDYPSDYHPPHDVGRGEAFLADVYEAVRSSPYRDKILLVITFDEHGGCYDHVAPPSGAAAPDPWPISRDGTFDFTRFGVRVPAIVISSYVRPGTVFRVAPGETPYDHTSILATLRDWLKLDSDPAHPFLPSPRIQAAPTLDRVLTLSPAERNTNWPKIVPHGTIGTDDTSFQTPLNDVQKSLLATALRQHHRQAAAALTSSSIPAATAPVLGDPISASTAKSLRTYEDAFKFLHPNLPN
jgi:phospholipase C